MDALAFRYVNGCSPPIRRRLEYDDRPTLRHAAKRDRADGSDSGEQRYPRAA